MTQLATFIVDKRNLFFLLIVVLLIFSAFSRNFEDKAKTESKPSVAGLIRRGKTTPSVNRTPPAAADDLMVLFRLGGEWRTRTVDLPRVRRTL